MNKDKFLPIGTIVKTSNNSNLLMITGYFMYDDNNGIERYDYATCKYPYGVLFTKSVKGINHNDIIEVVYDGYRNNDSKVLDDKLKNAISEIKMVPSSNNFFFDENGVVVTDTNEKIKEDNEYLTILENSQISNPFISNDKTIKEMNNIPDETDKWPIFKNIQFDESGNVIEAEEFDDKTSISNIKFDDNGLIISDGLEQPKLGIEFDENGFVISTESSTPISTNDNLIFNDDGTVREDKKSKINTSFKFDSEGRVLSDFIDNPESSLNKGITSIKFNEKGFVILDETKDKKNVKDEVVTIGDDVE